MHSRDLPGLTGEIADYLRQQPYKTCESFVIGAAIAAISSLSGARYRIAYPHLDPGQDDTIETQVIYQGVMLVGPIGSGKGGTIDAVSELFTLAGDDASIVHVASWQALWQSAARTPGLLWTMQQRDHYELIRRDSDYWHVGERLEPTISDILTALQRSAHDEIARLPFPSRGANSPQFIPPAPVTILTESTDSALRRKLPTEWSVSYYFGSLLLCGASQPRVRNNGYGMPPAEGLIEKLRYMSGLRKSGELVLVRWAEKAFEALRDICNYLQGVDRKFQEWGIMPPEPDWTITREKALNIGALLAIGANPDKPVITIDMLVTAWEIAVEDWRLLRAGSDVELPA